jgi:hypothetical protein
MDPELEIKKKSPSSLIALEQFRGIVDELK